MSWPCTEVAAYQSKDNWTDNSGSMMRLCWLRPPHLRPQRSQSSQAPRTSSRWRNHRSPSASLASSPGPWPGPRCCSTGPPGAGSESYLMKNVDVTFVTNFSIFEMKNCFKKDLLQEPCKKYG